MGSPSQRGDRVAATGFRAPGVTALVVNIAITQEVSRQEVKCCGDTCSDGWWLEVGGFRYMIPQLRNSFPYNIHTYMGGQVTTIRQTFFVLSKNYIAIK